MKTIEILLAIFAFSNFTSVAEEEVDYAKVKPSTISTAITRLLDKPLSEEADDYSALIVNFAQASPDIAISLNTNFLPWLEDDKLPELALRLTSAYVAGNVAEQIRLDKAEDSPAAGIVAALKMYRKLRQTETLAKIPILERWGKMTPNEILAEAEANTKKENKQCGDSDVKKAPELQLPNEIGSLEFVDRTEYDDKNLGYSFRYQNENSLKADVYVYDKGIGNLLEGIDSPQAASEMTSMGAALKQMEQLGKYEKVREGKSGTKRFDDLKIQFLWARHSYKHAPGEEEIFTERRISDTFLLIHQGSFIKIRITATEDDLKEHHDEIDTLLREIAKQIKKPSSGKGDSSDVTHPPH